MIDDDMVEYTVFGEDGSENYTYTVWFNPFRIEQRSNGILTQVINPRASLYVEDTVNGQRFGKEAESCFNGLRSRTQTRTGADIFAATNEHTSSISLSSWMPQQTLFGIPERESSLELRRTTGAAPFRLFATD